MITRIRSVALLTAAACLLLGVLAPTRSAQAARTAAGSVVFRPVCATQRTAVASCLTEAAYGADGRLLGRAGQQQTGLAPYQVAQLRSAYLLPTAAPSTPRTIAVVDAYDDPSAAGDLATYRSANGLPACSTAPCFTEVNENGGATLPAPNADWSVEISLDLDMVSAACPGCRILLVEADSADFSDLGPAEDTAVRLHATAVSNSYGAAEYPGETSDLRYYWHPGTLITASTGDQGYGPEAPSVSPDVLAVGGTSLYRNAAGRWQQAGWAEAGSGCSAYVTKPAWQDDDLCGMRTVADISAVADPYTPVAVYDSFDAPGWIAVGGTSVSSPLIAALLGGSADPSKYVPGYFYRHPDQLRDVTTGPPTGPCGRYLCTPVRGYDGPTGLGSPLGIGAR